jgi:hypothetical protein
MQAPGAEVARSRACAEPPTADQLGVPAAAARGNGALLVPKEETCRGPPLVAAPAALAPGNGPGRVHEVTAQRQPDLSVAQAAVAQVNVQ